MKNRLYQVSQELISHWTYEIETLTKIIDTYEFEYQDDSSSKKKNHKRILYCNMEQVQNYRYSNINVEQIMLYLMAISEQHLSIHEVLIHKLE